MRKISLSIVLFACSIVLAFGQYSFTWEEEAQTTANRFKLLYENNDQTNNFIEEYNYVFGSTIYNHTNAILWYQNEWYIKNEEGLSIPAGTKFHITRVGINETVFAHGTTSSNVEGYRTTIDHPDLNGNPNAIFIYSRLNSIGQGNDKTTDLQHFNDKWTIYNQDSGSLKLCLLSKRIWNGEERIWVEAIGNNGRIYKRSLRSAIRVDFENKKII